MVSDEDACAGRARAPLTRHRVLLAALALVERDGAEALSMRRLAKALGVEAMSLYNHVDGKDDVLDGITELVFAEIDSPAPTGLGWEEDLRALARALRTATTGRPRTSALVLTRQLHSPVALRAMEAPLSVLLSAGFDPASAVHAVRALLAFQIGSLLREVGASPSFSGHVPGAGHRRAEELSAGGFPAVALAARQLATCDHEAEYAFGVEALISALRTMRATSRTAGEGTG